MRNNETATVTISSTATSNTNSFVTASGSISIAGTINSGTVIEADLLAVDGVLHKIDSVVEPIFFSKYLLDTALDAGLTTFLALVDLVPGVVDQEARSPLAFRLYGSRGKLEAREVLD